MAMLITIQFQLLIMPFKSITNILFDTSFLLKDSPDVDKIIRLLRKDGISCYISSTVKAELDNLYYFGQISTEHYRRAMARSRKANAGNIEAARNFLEESITKECTVSMNTAHGVGINDVRGDCNILTSSLNHHIDLILSEDFHFTSKYTDNVVNTVCERTCDRFKRLCECDILALNKDTFLAAYKGKAVDLEVVASMRRDIRKNS